jgi:methionine-rich copper-binding protein CopC
MSGRPATATGSAGGGDVVIGVGERRGPVSRPLLALVAGLLLTPRPGARARLESSDPAEGAALTAVPSAVRLTFGEPVAGDSPTLALSGPGGAEVVLAAPAASGRVVTQPLPAELVNGVHTLSYEVVSTDGHTISGTVSFTLAAPEPVSRAPESTGSGTPVGSIAGAAALVVLLATAGA